MLRVRAPPGTHLEPERVLFFNGLLDESFVLMNSHSIPMLWLVWKPPSTFIARQISQQRVIYDKILIQAVTETSNSMLTIREPGMVETGWKQLNKNPS